MHSYWRLRYFIVLLRVEGRTWSMSSQKEVHNSCILVQYLVLWEALSSILTPPLHRRGDHNLEQNFSMFGNICKIADRYRRERFMRTLLPLALREDYTGSIFYRHRHLFFCNFFHLKEISAFSMFFWRTCLSPQHNFCLSHRIFLSSISCLNWKSPGKMSSKGAFRAHIDVLIGRDFF